MLDWLKLFFFWLLEQIASIANFLLAPIADAMPDLSGDIGLIYQYGALANEWIALDYAFVLFSAWFVIVGIVIGVKWILGLIPTIS
ncbi:MAG: hypothetical protein PHV82_04885 [Victivallaceae bacterium]|nr:hypothetical protein [Victivallaceae bacterium]